MGTLLSTSPPAAKKTHPCCQLEAAQLSLGRATGLSSSFISVDDINRNLCKKETVPPKCFFVFHFIIYVNVCRFPQRPKMDIMCMCIPVYVCTFKQDICGSQERVLGCPGARVSVVSQLSCCWEPHVLRKEIHHALKLLSV